MSDPVFEIPSDPKYIERASSRLLGALKELELSEETLFDIRLSFEEAVINAMKYGNRFDKNLPVVISYDFSGEKLEITIRDQGKGFDHSTTPDPRSETNILKNGGRGIFLIKNLMDEVKYNDSGNEIKMIKFISGGKANGRKG